MKFPFNASLACFIVALSPPSLLLAQVQLSISIGPPPIPVYEQPEVPEDGYAWTPGYWAMGSAGYFWVPGTWVMTPSPGVRAVSMRATSPYARQSFSAPGLARRGLSTPGTLP